MSKLAIFFILAVAITAVACESQAINKVERVARAIEFPNFRNLFADSETHKAKTSADVNIAQGVISALVFKLKKVSSEFRGGLDNAKNKLSEGFGNALDIGLKEFGNTLKNNGHKLSNAVDTGFDALKDNVETVKSNAKEFEGGLFNNLKK